MKPGDTSFFEFMEEYLRHNPPEGKEESVASPHEPRVALKRLPTDDILDLHGLTVTESELMIDRFLRRCASAGMKKVLVIHGKGNHSDSGGVLRDAVRRILERHPCAGETGTPGRDEGGTGATWVRVKRKKPAGDFKNYRSR